MIWSRQVNIFIRDQIPRYISMEKGESKEKEAKDVFNQVLSFRGKGYLRNNPNSVKEVSFYRARAAYFEDKNKDLTETVMALKAGRSGIG
jgi:hypothetical protein